MREFELNNGIKTCLKVNKNTPRIALSLNFSIKNPEKNAGEYLLLSRLLMKGTEKYSSEELSAILEENAIDLITEMKYDYLRFRFVALNEDFELALSILSDIILNTTFADFEKEREKLKGELVAELDSAKVRISDLFTQTVYKGHYYGHSYTDIINQIDNVTKEDVTNSYKDILENSHKVLAVAGDAEFEYADKILNKYLGIIPASKNIESNVIPPEKIDEKRYSEVKKEDAQQAQIIQGWIVPSISSGDYVKLMLLNIILGASGLSSRLFLELREKKGLAYTVRTSYETRDKSAVFSIYIGTEPSNIQTSIEGFKEEIEKIKNIAVSEEELQSAKNNIIGKQQFITETNSQQANLMAFYAISGKPFGYQQDVINNIRKVTPDELQECAKKYFTDEFVLSVLKP